MSAQELMQRKRMNWVSPARPQESVDKSGKVGGLISRRAKSRSDFDENELPQRYGQAGSCGTFLGT